MTRASGLAPVAGRLAAVLPTLYGVRSVATSAWIGAVSVSRPTGPNPGPSTTLRLLLALSRCPGGKG
jgi:hypothetical protein